MKYICESRDIYLWIMKYICESRDIYLWIMKYICESRDIYLWIKRLIWLWLVIIWNVWNVSAIGECPLRFYSKHTEPHCWRLVMGHVMRVDRFTVLSLDNGMAGLSLILSFPLLVHWPAQMCSTQNIMLRSVLVCWWTCSLMSKKFWAYINTK